MAELQQGYIEAQFAIDLEDPVTGYHRPDQSWNGFACPCFELHEIEKWLEGQFWIDREHNISPIKWDCSHLYDRIAVYQSGNDPEDWDNWDNWEVFEGHDILVDGEQKHVYSVGAFCWTWTLVEEGKS